MTIRYGLKARTLLVAVVSLLLITSVGVGAAVADPPQFSMSHLSGRPGFSPRLAEADPCPSGITGQYFRATITTSNNVVETDYMSVDSNGHWEGSFPLVVPLNAAQGTAVVTGKCFIWPSTTTMEYASKQFTVTGAAAILDLPRTTVGRGETLRAGSSVDCPPAPSGEFLNYQVELLDSNGWGAYSFIVEPTWEGNGDWNFVADIPDTVQAGAYQLSMTCWSAGAGLRYVPAQVQVVNPPGLVALGDSVTAGEGTGTYLANSGACHRSSLGYPAYVAAQKNISAYAFKACGGARTADFDGFNPSNSAELPQRDWLTGTTELVTVTMGGNDAGFANVMNVCAEFLNHSGWGCKYNAPMVTELYARIDALAGSGTTTGDDGRQIKSLKQLYLDMAAEAPNARIFVGGYPKIFGDSTQSFSQNSSAPSGYACNLAFSVSVDYDDAQWLGQVAEDLNTVIENAVLSANAEGANVYFVPAVSAFATHGLCDSSTSWFNPVFLTPTLPPAATPESLHPTSTGYAQGYGVAFVSKMNSIG